MEEFPNNTKRLSDSFLKLMIESSHFEILNSTNNSEDGSSIIIIPILPNNNSFYSTVKSKFNVTVKSQLINQSQRPIMAILLFAPANNSMQAFNDLRKATDITILTPPQIVSISNRLKKETVPKTLKFNFEKFLEDLNEPEPTQTKYEDMAQIAVVMFPNAENMKNDIKLMKQTYAVKIGPPIYEEKIKSYFEVKDK